MRHLLNLLFCLCTGLACGHAAEAQNRLSITLNGESAGKVGGVLHTIMNLDVSFDHGLISDGVYHLSLHQANRAALLQALAHGAGGWWWFDRFDRRYRITTSIAPRMTELAEVRSHPTSLVNRHDLEPIIHQLMAPWTEQKGNGLASVPWTGQWSATLPPQGHSQLTNILRLLELGEHAIPSPLPQQDLPAKSVFAARDTPFVGGHAAWSSFLLDAAKHFRFSLSVAPSVVQLPAKNILGRWQSLPDLLDFLHDGGLQAQWVSGVLCVDLVPVQRKEHPIFARQVMLLPIPHLINKADGHLLAAQLKQATAAAIAWSEGGRLCTFIEQPPRLLIAVEGQAVNHLLDALDRFERSGGQSWDGP